MAGNDLTTDIQEHMGRVHNLKVGATMAEQIKINVGSALPVLDNPPEPYIVRGPNRMSALPMEVLLRMKRSLIVLINRYQEWRLQY